MNNNNISPEYDDYYDHDYEDTERAFDIHEAKLIRDTTAMPIPLTDEYRAYKRQLRVCTVLFVLVVVAASWYTYHMCSNGGHMYEGLKIVALHT